MRAADEASDAAVETDRLAAELLSHLNAAREVHGLEPLATSGEVEAVAIERVLEMATTGYFAHHSPTGIGAVQILERRGVDYRELGENIARTTATGANMVAIVSTAVE